MSGKQQRFGLGKSSGRARAAKAGLARGAADRLVSPPESA
jgi:hypothetical protein